MNKFTLFLFMMCLFTLGAKAQDVAPVQIGDLYYLLDDVSLTAETAAMPVVGEGDDAVQPRYTFTTLTVPETVEYNGKTYQVVKIGDGSLRELPNLTMVTIPASVTTIGNSAFAQCPNLTAVTNSISASTIEDYAFYSCSKLAFFVFSPDITEIAEHSFQQCSSLTNITIPEGVTAIKSCAFQTCSNLKSITIPSTVNEIDAWTFDGTSVTSITVPEGVTSISAWTFSNNSALTTLKLPASLTSMDDWACDKDDGLKEIYIAWQTPPDPNDPDAAITGIKWWSFGDKVDRSSCIVYVPSQYRDAYGDTWLDFPVESYDMASIATVPSETNHVYYADGTLNLFNLDGYTVSVFSATGQLAATFKASGSGVQLPLTPGVYILKAAKGQDTKVIKFIAK